MSINILTACARLHNFINNQDGLLDDSTSSLTQTGEAHFLEITPNAATPLGLSYLPTVPDDFCVFDSVTSNCIIL